MEIFFIYLPFIFLSVFLNYLVIRFKDFFSRVGNEIDTVQRIHHQYVPPLGGVIIFMIFYLYLKTFNSNSFFLHLSVFLPGLLIIIVSVIEDLFANIKPSLRFITIFFSSFIFVYFYQEQLPILDISFIKIVFNKFVWIEILFYSLGLTALANGFNMIDGMNGLAGFNGLSILIGIASVLLINNQFDLLSEEITMLIILLVIFLFFNFPFGKIFLGDSGAYWIGWILGVMVIYLYSNNDFNTWGAVLLIFYPLFEVIFSTLRKFIQYKNPLLPDEQHLHLKLYYTIKGPARRSQQFNSFTTLCLMPLWFLPNLMIIWTFFYSHLSIIAIGLMSLIYIYFYYVIPEKN